MEDEPLHISFNEGADGVQALPEINSHPIHKHRQKPTAHKKMEKKTSNRFSKRSDIENEEATKFTNTGDKNIEADDLDKSKVCQETDVDNVSEERNEECGIEETLADTDEMQAENDMEPQKKDHKFIDYSSTQISEDEGTNNRNKDDNGDENYDLENDYDHSGEEILRNDDSNDDGEHAIYQQKEDNEQRTVSKISSAAKTEGNAKIYKHVRSSRSSENEDKTKDNKKTENHIKARIDALKDAIKEEIAREEITRI
jgi:hypothetical protein